MTASLQEQLDTAPNATFVIERELGGGGMSRVFLAVDRELGRRIVVKVLPPELLTDASVERFRREIRIAANLRHPNIVPVLIAGQAGALVYYTMPFVEGESLRERMAGLAPSGYGVLPLAETLTILRDVARALAYAHRNNVVHRDIKPENILLSADGLLVTDFGIAKALSLAVPDAPAITSVGVFVGTPAYMAPEQAVGDSDADHRADLYSLGAMAYEMLTGAPPFAGRTLHQTLAAHSTLDAEPLATKRPDVPAPLADLVMRCLAKRPADRPQSADALVEVLDQLIHERRARSRRWKWRRGFTIAAGLIALAILGAAVRIARQSASTRSKLLTVVTRKAAVLRPNRFVITPFDNRTGDSSLNVLGDEAAYFIGVALQNTFPTIQVVDSRSTRANVLVVASIPWYLRLFHSEARALADESEAAMVISGAYYLEGSQVRIHAEMRNFAHRTQAIQDTAGPRTNPREIIRAVQNRVVGAVALLSDSTVVSTPGAYSDPPSLDAYTKLFNAERAYFMDDTAFYSLYHAAERLDPNWVTPTAFLAYADGWNGRSDELAKDLARGRQLSSRMAASERHMFAYANAMYDGRLSDMLEAAGRFSESLPGSAEGSLLLSSTALGLHDTAVAVKALARADPDRGLNLVSGYYWLSRIGLEKERGAGAAVLETAHIAERRFPEWVEFRNYEVRELAKRGEVNALRAVIEGAQLRHRPNVVARFVVASQAATALSMNGRTDDATNLAREWIPVALTLRGDTSHWARRSIANLLAVAGRWDELAALPSGAFIAAAGQQYADRISFAAVGSIHRGDTAAARRAESMLAASRPAHLDFGYHELARARIAAHFGEFPRAIKLLDQAIAEGVRLHLPWGADFRTDAFLLPLRGDSAFIALAAKP